VAQQAAVKQQLSVLERHHVRGGWHPADARLYRSSPSFPGTGSASPMGETIQKASGRGSDGGVTSKGLEQANCGAMGEAGLGNISVERHAEHRRGSCAWTGTLSE